MNPLEEESISCPYCNEIFEIVIDCSQLHQEYIEDCYVCCNPIQIQVAIEDDAIQLSVDII